MSADPQALEERIGHRFSNAELLRRALTHSSHAHENAPPADGSHRDNEQLEFLGDAVLGFVVSEALVERFPSYSEGKLSTLKAHLVSAVHLHTVAQAVGLGAHLQLGRSEEMTGGREKKTLLVDALEALIAALYLDSGMPAAREFVVREVINSSAIATAGELPPPVVDYKTALQELARMHGLPQPRYSVLREEGPGHSRMYTMEVRVGPEWSGSGEGPSKKGAAQRAARQVYDRLRGGGPSPA